MRTPSRAAKRSRYVRLVDDYIERHVEWREECADAEPCVSALDPLGAERPSSRLVAYRAALQREETASRARERSVRRLQRRGPVP